MAKIRAPKSEGIPEGDTFSTAFARLLEIHRVGLGLSNITELFNLTKEACGEGVDLSNFGRWKSGSRGVSREMIAKLAVTIVKQYEVKEMTKKVEKLDLPDDDKLTAKGWAYLPWTIARFSAVAGLVSHRLILSEPENVSWDHIRNSLERTLKIGFVECPPWAEKPGKGVSIEVANLVAGLLGCKAEFVPYNNWGELVQAIRSRAIDITAPIMVRTPSRLMDLLFSKPLSADNNTEFKISMLVVGSQFPHQETPLVLNQTPNLLVGHVRGEIGELAAYLGPKEGAVEHENLAEAIRWMKDGNKNRPRVVAYEDNTLQREADKDSSLAVVEAHELRALHLTLCFATHTHEPQLMHAINSTLELAHGRISEETLTVKSQTGKK